MDTAQILRRLYGIEPPRKRRWFLRPIDSFKRAMAIAVRRHNWRLAITALFVGGWLAMHIYYYNQLVSLEFDVKSAWAQVEVSQEKRNHIQRNLRQLLQFYSGYERELMMDVTETRTSARAAPDPTDDDSVSGMLGRLEMIAENYPNLHLENSVGRFSDAVIQSETEIAKNIADYNNAVNIYTTVLNQFPSMLFARTLGFDSYDFYEPEDRTVLDYRELDL